MSVEIAWKQNILVTDSYLLKLLLVVLGFGLQAFVCDFSRQNICSVLQFAVRRAGGCAVTQRIYLTLLAISTYLCLMPEYVLIYGAAGLFSFFELCPT